MSQKGLVSNDVNSATHVSQDGLVAHKLWVVGGVNNDDVNTGVNACPRMVNNDDDVNTDVNCACVPGRSCERANVKGQSSPQEQKHQWKVRMIFILLLLIKYHVGCWI